MDDERAAHVSANPIDHDARYDGPDDDRLNYHVHYHDHCDDDFHDAYSHV